MGTFDRECTDFYKKMVIFNRKYTVLFKKNGHFRSKTRLISIYGQELPLYGRYKTRL